MSVSGEGLLLNQFHFSWPKPLASGTAKEALVMAEISAMSVFNVIPKGHCGSGLSWKTASNAILAPKDKIPITKHRISRNHDPFEITLNFVFSATS